MFRATLSLVLFTSSALAGSGSWVELNTTKLWLAANATPEAVEAAITHDFQGVLRRYKPNVGSATLKSYSVTGSRARPTMNISASKKISFFTKSIDIVGKSSIMRLKCDGVAGYRIDFDLSSSNDTVSDNARTLRLDLCVTERGKYGDFYVVSHATMEEGNDFGGVTGEPTKVMLGAQNWPIMLALNAYLGM